MIRTLLISASALALAAAPVMAETLAAVGKIWTGTDQGVIEDGIVVITDGVVTAVGGSETAIPSGAKILGGDGSWVTPGIISPFSRTGLVEVGAEKTTNDRGGSSDKFSVALRASDGFNPAATPIAATRIEGVTRIVVAPDASGSLFAGQGFFANTSGAPGSITDPSSFVYAEIGIGGKSRAAGGTRSASWAYLRQAFSEARLAASGLFRAHERSALSDADARALANVIRGQTKLVLRAHRASDLLKIIDLQAEQPLLDIIIIGADEGWMVADEIAAADIPVVVDPFQNLPASFEQLGATSRNAERLIEAGVETAFAHMGDDGHQARLVLQSAGNAVANGVAHEDALAAITNVPAEMFGLDGYGSLAVGTAGDIVVWDGDPLEVTVSPEAVVIDGEEQSLDSRQTKLRDRYLDLETNDKPFTYRKP